MIANLCVVQGRPSTLNLKFLTPTGDEFWRGLDYHAANYQLSIFTRLWVTSVSIKIDPNFWEGDNYQGAVQGKEAMEKEEEEEEKEEMGGRGDPREGGDGREWFIESEYSPLNEFIGKTLSIERGVMELGKTGRGKAVGSCNTDTTF